MWWSRYTSCQQIVYRCAVLDFINKCIEWRSFEFRSGGGELFRYYCFMKISVVKICCYNTSLLFGKNSKILPSYARLVVYNRLHFLDLLYFPVWGAVWFFYYQTFLFVSFNLLHFCFTLLKKLTIIALLFNFMEILM